LDGQSDLLSQVGDAPLNVSNQYFIEGLAEEWDAHTIAHSSVSLVPRKVNSFSVDSISDCHVLVNLKLRSAFYSKVAKFHRIKLSI
jgi:hypothetical protein